MPIKNCQIRKINGTDQAVFLPIRITNPHTGKTFKTWGLIDTGASDCAIPAQIAVMLGHNLNGGQKTNMSTGNGNASAFRHTTTISIFHPDHPDDPNKAIHTLDNVLIDCMPNLPLVLLGVKGFLSEFKLTIDYPNKVFSLSR